MFELKRNKEMYIFNGTDIYISSASRYNSCRNTAFIVHQWIILDAYTVTSPQSCDLNSIVHSELH